MNTIPAKEKQLLDCLTAAVAEALERKRRLGQYAVVWQDGKPALIGEDAPGALSAKFGAVSPSTNPARKLFEREHNQSFSTQGDNHERP